MLKDSFWNIHLNEKSSYLTTFNTQHGRYWFLHMPFSLKMSQDIFQMCMDQGNGPSPWHLLPFHDNIYIYSHTPNKHNWHPLKLIKTAAQHGGVFNSSKCQIRQPKIAIYSVFSLQKACSPILPNPRPYKTSPHLSPSQITVIFRPYKLLTAIHSTVS